MATISGVYFCVGMYGFSSTRELLAFAAHTYHRTYSGTYPEHGYVRLMFELLPIGSFVKQHSAKQLHSTAGVIQKTQVLRTLQHRRQHTMISVQNHL